MHCTHDRLLRQASSCGEQHQGRRQNDASRRRRRRHAAPRCQPTSRQHLSRCSGGLCSLAGDASRRTVVGKCECRPRFPVSSFSRRSSPGVTRFIVSLECALSHPLPKAQPVRNLLPAQLETMRQEKTVIGTEGGPVGEEQGSCRTRMTQTHLFPAASQVITFAGIPSLRHGASQEGENRSHRTSHHADVASGGPHQSDAVIPRADQHHGHILPAAQHDTRRRSPGLDTRKRPIHATVGEG